MSRPGKTAGALAPVPLSEWLARQKLAQRRQRRAAGQRRRVTAQRLADAEVVIKAIAEGGDVLAEVLIDRTRPYAEPGVVLMVTMTAYEFRRLCLYGAELEHDEEECHDEGAGEAEDDEKSDDDEASLGSCDGITDQTRWAEGDFFHGDDNERDESDSEPSLGRPDSALDQDAPWLVGDRRDLEGGFDEIKVSP